MTADPAGSAPAAGPHPPRPHHQHFWLWVMCLTGVDYFSTLGYQPSIAFNAAGLLTPFATLILVLVTLLGALPVYAHVAAASPHGQGSIGMLERLVRGWWGKLLVLVLLGFAATDFVITQTLSAADAAAHLIENPLFSGVFAGVPHAQVVVTMVLLVALGAMFLRGFREVIGVAVVIVAVYLLLNLVVVGSGLAYLVAHPGGTLNPWLAALSDPDADPATALHLRHAPIRPGGSPLGILGLCLLLFPQLALGLSGFETGVAVMPLVRGDPADEPRQPRGRIRNTRKLLLLAALVMSALLLGSSLVTTTLIPAREMLGHQAHGEAASDEPAARGRAVDRALAYLAHGEPLADGQPGAALNPAFGEAFGTAYDLSTVAILWFAGASALAGLLNLVPQYPPRYGMAPEWARATRPLVLLFTAVNLVVTLVFRADVAAQGGAYATGVLVLISSACVATLIDTWRGRTGPWWRRLSWRYAAIAAVFFYVTADVVVSKRDGLLIAAWFIAAIVVASVVSRLRRSTELRFAGWRFADDQSRFLWDSLKHLEFPVLVPHRPGARSLADKEEVIRSEHRLTADVPIVFVEAELGDPSDFYQTPEMEVKHKQGRFVVRVSRCSSIPHAVAAVALELSKVGKPPEIHFGWSGESPVVANLGFLLLGEGNVPWMVRELILQAEPDPQRQPRVVIG